MMETMNTKNKIIAGVLLVIFIGLGVWLWLAKTPKQPAKTEQSTADYYSQLTKLCANQDKSALSCCEQSVAFMKKNNYVKTEEGKCKSGMDKNQLLCAGSYEWCEPGTGEAQENKESN